MSRRFLTAALAGLIVTTAAAASGDPLPPPVKPDQLPGLLTAIKPKAGEDNWLSIPWLASLNEARKRAAAQGKPILLWEMDGHPLGCT